MSSKISEDSITASVIGIDIGKEVFYLVGFSADGRLVLRHKIKRLALEATFKKLPPEWLLRQGCCGRHVAVPSDRSPPFETGRSVSADAV